MNLMFDTASECLNSGFLVSQSDVLVTEPLRSSFYKKSLHTSICRKILSRTLPNLRNKKLLISVIILVMITCYHKLHTSKNISRNMYSFAIK